MNLTNFSVNLLSSILSSAKILGTEIHNMIWYVNLRVCL